MKLLAKLALKQKECLLISERLRMGLPFEQAASSSSNLNYQAPLLQVHSQHDEFDDEFDDAILMDIDVTNIMSTHGGFANDLAHACTAFVKNVEHVLKFLNELQQARFNQSIDPHYAISDELYIATIDCIAYLSDIMVSQKRKSLREVMETFGPNAFWASVGKIRFHEANRFRCLRFICRLFELRNEVAETFADTVMQVWFEAAVDCLVNSSSQSLGPAFSETFASFSAMMISSECRPQLLSMVTNDSPLLLGSGRAEFMNSAFVCQRISSNFL